MGTFPKVTDCINAEKGFLDLPNDFYAFENAESRQFSSQPAAFCFIIRKNHISITEMAP